jgi:hypothetical protein
MIFLIDYDRPSGSIVTITPYADSCRRDAETARLSLEIKNFDAGVLREIVLLEAAAEVDLRRTHRRYFEPLEQLTKSPTLMTASAHQPVIHIPVIRASD